MSARTEGTAAGSLPLKISSLTACRDVILRDSDEPLYHQLYTQLRHLIVASGRVGPGSRLPSSRALAAALGISRNTVLLAYQRLQEDGCVEGRAGGGTVVSTTLRAPHRGPAVRSATAPGSCSGPTPAPARTAAPAPRPSAVGTAFPVDVPPLDLFPMQLWTALLSRRLRLSGERLLVGADRLGLPALRAAIAAFLGASRGIVCSPDQVVVTRGVEATVELLARSLLDVGDTVWCEDPGDPRLRQLLCWNGAEPVAIPVDQDGLNVWHAVEHHPGARLAVVSAAHQLPLGAALSPARRTALLRHAREHGGWIVDVERDGPFLNSRADRALWSEAGHDQVIHVGSFDSVLFPQVRLGYCVLPPELLDRVDRVAGVMDTEASAVTQAALADFLEHHRFVGFLHRSAEACAERRAALLRALCELHGDDRHLVGHEQGGGFLTVALPNSARLGPVPAPAGPATRPPVHLGRYAFHRPALPGFVLGFASLREAQIPAAVRAWAPLLAAGDQPRRGRLAG
ncbi:PLP-dependent aminotransferase family protein [Kitasatospora viridis]|uniref:GntR family transcriptional regulator/MocR family aminotransferase n=1 Tax=Kitasatospora viridis TaxID=281105 RepID=A0A561T7B3_9ACTN|nr:PLP-dependent aminotransferase family protein [Kitasatospora viridis]TWF83001.1 GntR family transcriptional regulator/MocR family aminotransferase [Kitasatospora viridis]